MLDLRPAPEATISPGVPKLLQEGYYVKFTDLWPKTLAANVSGKCFQIEKTNHVPYDLKYILPTNDFRDVNLANVDGGENLYPEGLKTLYEIALGFKPGNYLTHFFAPAAEAISRLEQAGMTPDVTHATRRYLGARKPEDSPYHDKRIFIYTVKGLEPMIMRLFVDTGIAFEACILGLIVNKCRLVEITNPSHEQLRLARKVFYYTELRW